jgi:hypothetical protein
VNPQNPETRIEMQMAPNVVEVETNPIETKTETKPKLVETKTKPVETKTPKFVDAKLLDSVLVKLNSLKSSENWIILGVVFHQFGHTHAFNIDDFGGLVDKYFTVRMSNVLLENVESILTGYVTQKHTDGDLYSTLGHACASIIAIRAKSVLHVDILYDLFDTPLQVHMHGHENRISFKNALASCTDFDTFNWVFSFEGTQ